MGSGDSVDFLLRTLRHWKLVLGCVIVCVAVAAAAAFTETEKYTSQVQLFVSAQDTTAASTAADVYSGDQFTAARVQSYIDLVSSPEISAPVIRRLGLHMTHNQFVAAVTAAAPANTVLLNLSVNDPSPKRAQRIAAATAQQYIKVIYQLEAIPGKPSPVRVSVSSPASLPLTASSPNKKLDIAIGVLLGLLIGIGAAQILERLDNTVADNDDEINNEFGLQVLTHVPYDNHASEGLAGLRNRESAARIEAFRRLRTSLRYLDVDNPPRVIVVTSCAPNEGKSISCVSLAAVLADQGQKVLLVEGDLRRPRLARYTGVDRSAQGLAEVLADGDDPQEHVITVEGPAAPDGLGGLDLLSSGSVVPNPSELLGSQRMKTLIEDVGQAYDFVVVDAPPLLLVTDAVLLPRSPTEY